MKEPMYELEFESSFVPNFEKYPRNSPPFNWFYFD